MRGPEVRSWERKRALLHHACRGRGCRCGVWVPRSPSLRPVCCGGGCGAWGRRCGLRARGVGPPSPSMRRVCCGRGLRALCCGGGCGAWGCRRGRRARGTGPRSPSMHRVCCGRGLCAVCVVVAGAARWVAVVVFARMAWGRGRRRCGACVVVAVFVPCVVVVGAARRVVVAGAVVVVAFVLRVVSLSPFPCRVGCRWCLRCVGCGVAAVDVVPRVVYAAARGGDGAARRDAATWRT